ncbi:hypothetical protein POTOM_040826 [Populus tomentosa]|uniref:RNA ligase/cyclic nucleotide phosphodiesterase family protein n=1 Tax=Populus tomentosa TaxID=118781 RepID=A0A8X7YUT8_POPTO|nr:hypothetical protein POTOM_040826 [Populus tomentosa]
MEIPQGTSTPADKKHVYSVWAIPPEDVGGRLTRLMAGLASELGGPQFEPHITVVGAIGLTEQDALEKFHSACDGLQAYTATVDRVATGTFFYQCVYLLLHPVPEVVEASAHCSGHFGYKSSTRKFNAIFHSSFSFMNSKRLLFGGKKCAVMRFVAFWECSGCASLPIEPPFTYMPHLSLLYGDLTDDEKKEAQEKANILDESISGLSFPITRLALWKTDTQDLTLKSWEKIAECSLSPK